MSRHPSDQRRHSVMATNFKCQPEKSNLDIARSHAGQCDHCNELVLCLIQADRWRPADRALNGNGREKLVMKAFHARYQLAIPPHPSLDIERGNGINLLKQRLESFNADFICPPAPIAGCPDQFHKLGVSNRMTLVASTIGGPARKPHQPLTMAFKKGIADFRSALRLASILTWLRCKGDCLPPRLSFPLRLLSQPLLERLQFLQERLH